MLRIHTPSHQRTMRKPSLGVKQLGRSCAPISRVPRHARLARCPAPLGPSASNPSRCRNPPESVPLMAGRGRYEIHNLIEFFSGKKHRKGDLSVADPQVWSGRKLTPEELTSLQTPT